VPWKQQGKKGSSGRGWGRVKGALGRKLDPELQIKLSKDVKGRVNITKRWSTCEKERREVRSDMVSDSEWRGR